MDGHRFDSLARSFAAARSRRSVLKALGGALVAGTIGTLGRIGSSAQNAATPIAEDSPTIAPTETVAAPTETATPSPTEAASPVAEVPTSTPTPIEPTPTATEDLVTAVAPALTLRPVSARVRSTVSATVVGFRSGELVNLQINALRSEYLPVATGTASASGELVMPFRVPNMVRGQHKVQATGDMTSLAETLITIRPSVSLEPKQAIPGSSIKVVLRGFAGRTAVDVRFWRSSVRSGTPQILATLTTSSHGYAWGMITVPADSAEGEHIIDGAERTSRVKVGTIFTALPAYPPPARPQPVRATVLDTSSIRLDWDDAADETGYRLNFRTGQVDIPADTTTYTDTDMAPDTTRFYSLQAFNNAGDSEWSYQTAATTYHAMCTSNADCDALETCNYGDCDVDHCSMFPTACTVEAFIVVPTDKEDSLPDDATLIAKMTAAMDTVAGFYQTKAGVTMHRTRPQILHAPYDSAWFAGTGTGLTAATDLGLHVWDYEESFAAAEADGFPPVDFGRFWQYMGEVGKGLCRESVITYALIASTLGGGTVGGSRCGFPQRQTDDSGPDMGPGSAGFGFASQWVLDTVLTGEDSQSCYNEFAHVPEQSPWPCPANVSWGTIVHEIGHGFGLPHPCEGWGAEHWQIPPDVCDGLIMQAHWNYPNSTFHAKEAALLALSKVFD